MEVLKKVEGAYALLFKSTHYPGELVACKRGSPMILGIKVPVITKGGCVGWRGCCAVLRCAVLCCAVLCCAALCCAALCSTRCKHAS
jgi:glucosamine 6-phosphate synthetase-like amidotransferase/phosphosugar isomerase protein